MAKDTFYFSHDYNSRVDEKIRLLIRKHGMLGYGVFWSVIEDLYNNDNSLKLDYEGIGYDLRVDADTIKSIINDFSLFVIDVENFGSESVERRLNERKEKSRKASESANYKWKNKKNDANALNKDANALLPHSDSTDKGCEGNAIKERKGKEIKVKERTYIEEEFRDSFMEFLDYKKERKEGYKTEKSEILAYNNLKKLSDNSPEKAKLIVEQCMANNWAGLFALRVDTGKSSNPTSTPKSTINDEYDIVYDYIIKNLPRCKMSTSPLDRREFNSLKISAEQAKIFLHIIEKMDRIGSVYSEMEKMVWEQRYIASKQLNK